MIELPSLVDQGEILTSALYGCQTSTEVLDKIIQRFATEPTLIRSLAATSAVADWTAWRDRMVIELGVLSARSSAEAELLAGLTLEMLFARVETRLIDERFHHGAYGPADETPRAAKIARSKIHAELSRIQRDLDAVRGRLDEQETIEGGALDMPPMSVEAAHEHMRPKSFSIEDRRIVEQPLDVVRTRFAQQGFTPEVCTAIKGSSKGGPPTRDAKARRLELVELMDKEERRGTTQKMIAEAIGWHESAVSRQLAKYRISLAA